jgi:hypothetical protein
LITAPVRRDRWEEFGHYERWREDFDCVQELGITSCAMDRHLHRTSWGLGTNKYDWSFADETLHDMKARDIVPITD